MFIVHMNVQDSYGRSSVYFIQCMVCIVLISRVMSEVRVSVSNVSVCLVVRNRSVQASVCTEIGYVAYTARF